MKTSISSRLLPSALAPALSRSSRMVDAGRGATVSAIGLACRAGLRLQIGAAVDARYPRQEIIDLGLCGRRNRRAGLALRSGRDDAALLQYVFAHRQTRAGLLLVADQRQMGVEQIVRRIALAGLLQLDDIDQPFRHA